MRKEHMEKQVRKNIAIVIAVVFAQSKGPGSAIAASLPPGILASRSP